MPILEYSKNLKEIVSYIKATGVDRVVLLTPPPVSDKGRKRSQIQVNNKRAHHLMPGMSATEHQGDMPVKDIQ